MGIRNQIIGLFVLGLVGCSPQTPKLVTEQALFQVSTIDALMQGVFDGNTKLSELSKKGDFGIGTLNALDGELVLENGQFFQVKADGKVYRPSGETLTPFASVVKFAPEDSMEVHNLDFSKLKHLVDSLMRSSNYFYAIRLDGQFESVHTRSVPAQQKPYPELVVVTRVQPEFNIPETHGKLTGFFCPEFVKGINISGYHLHFLSDDKTSGGHLLDFQLKSGMLKLDRISKFEMQLPESGDFQKSDFKTDRSAQVKEAESK
jgi:acetolactate decarboxylase